MSEIVSENIDPTEGREMSEAIFKCVDELYLGVSRPIFKIYPDLHPGKECRRPTLP